MTSWQQGTRRASGDPRGALRVLEKRSPGWTPNLHSSWEIRGFSHPSYPDLPADFDLYRRDNEVEGGSYHADFDAWLVPR